MIDGLKKIGLTVTYNPTGAFYVFVNVEHISHDSYQLAFDILNKAHRGTGKTVFDSDPKTLVEKVLELVKKEKIVII